MRDKQRLFPLTWPEIPSASAPYIFGCSSSNLGWISKNKSFYFAAKSCLSGIPPIPGLLTCISTDGGRRVDRYRTVNPRIVGIGFMRRMGDVHGDNNSIFISVDLVRIGKPEFEILSKEGVDVARGRRPVPTLHVADFAASLFDEAALTHWLAHPMAANEYPSARIAHNLFPDDLIRMCQRRNIADANHPFSADYKMNQRLLPDDDAEFTFIDLFAGIGGFRMAMQQEHGHCIFSSEIDKSACHTYRSNFGDQPFGDITQVETKGMIPDRFDLLCAGFPCQAFSTAGLRKGFGDERQRGTLYKQVVEIARVHQPKAIFCENVKGLLSSAGGSDFQTIKNEIEDVGYHIVFESILNSKDYGVPQNRERLYIVALRNDLFAIAQQKGLSFPRRPDPIPGTTAKTIGDIREIGPVAKSYYLGQSYLETLIRHRKRHADAPGGSGFGYIVRTDDQIAATLMCGGMGRERNMLHDENQPDWTPTKHMKGGLNKQHLRFMTVREWARLQGFPDYFTTPDSIQAGYKQFGNCVTVKTIRAVGRAILNLVAKCEEEQ